MQAKLLADLPCATMNPWISSAQLGLLKIAPAVTCWLTEAGSLTARLRQRHPLLAVDVVREELEPPLPDEANRLMLTSTSLAWIREVRLHENGLALLQARTVVPHWCPDNPWSEVQRLGKRPLGEILFGDPSLDRSPFEFSFGPGWRDSGTASVPDRPMRRCVFHRQQAPLLLTERFLLLAP